MVNINGKEWALLEPSDIQALLSEQDLGESFYFEFKEDNVSNDKVIAEISALANTFGGYIFLGVSDSNGILGCTSWNEQRIHNVVHNCITPTPSFDVKQFTIDNQVIYVIKIDEGAEPPYITNKGKIYERLSSGSFAITNSAKLSQIYTKREQLLEKMERKISIPTITEKSDNIYGYIDLGFSVTPSDIQTAVAYIVMEKAYGKKELPDPTRTEDCSPEYWAGWAIAEYQWYTGRRFKDIFERTPLSRIIGMYPLYHEMDITNFISTMEEFYQAAQGDAKLKRIRESRGLSQSELAQQSGVHIRNIQAYEQRDNDIDKAQAKILYKLSRVLGCEVEDLLENPMA